MANLGHAEAGEDVVIARDGKPVVRLTPVKGSRDWLRRIEGAWVGRMIIADDFDDPIPGFEDDFYDGPIEP